MAHLKGRNVNLLIKEGSTYNVVAASTSCDFNLTANSDNAAAKDDPGNGMYDNPEFMNYSWSMSNESFLVDIAYLGSLLHKIINGDATLDVQYQHESGYDGTFTKRGIGIVSNLTVDAPNGGFVKITVSMDGNGALANQTMATDIVPATEFAQRIKGKALMIAMKADGKWHTIACSKSHKLTVALTLSDITDKDYNDSTVLKEITKKSVSLSTENLLEVITATTKPRGIGINALFDALTNGNSIEMEFGYYPNSIGATIHDGQTSTHKEGWGEPTSVLLSGTFLCTSISSNGQVEQDATFSAEFSNKGAVTVSTPSAAATAEE